MERLTEKVSKGSYKLNNNQILINKCGKAEDFIDFVLAKCENGDKAYYGITEDLKRFGLL